MKIIYLTNARLPTEKAHGLAAVKLSEAFAKQGARVLIVAPRRVNILEAGVFEYYRAEKIFGVRKLPCIDFLWLGVLGGLFFPIQLFSFSIAAFFFLAWQRLRGNLDGETVVFSHDHVPLFFASFIAPRMCYDIHDYPGRSRLFRRVLARAQVLAVQTKWKVGALAKDFGAPEENVVYWPNGTDAARFEVSLSKEEARRALMLPQDKKIVLYAGSLQKWKGVETLVRSAAFLPSEIFICVVGGSAEEIANVQCSMFNVQTGAQFSNVIFAGQKPWNEIPQWLAAADLLALPNTGREEISSRWTSPMKLFEYMAAGRPIIAADIPSIREILDEETGFFANPDDPRSFAQAILAALADPGEALRRARNAKNAVGQYTWAARAEKIAAALKLRISGE